MKHTGDSPEKPAKNARILALANQKGGVGKTTTAISLAAALALLGHRVLLVDLDPQGNTTGGLGVDKGSLGHTVYDWLLGGAPFGEIARMTELSFLTLAPANRDLVGAEIELVAAERREYRLRDGLQSATNDYDFVVIDCPPALNMLTVNGFAAADAVIIPMQCEYYALEGLSDLVGTLRKVKQNLNPRIEIEALVRTMYDPRSALTVQVSDELKRHYGDKVFDTVIPRNIRIAEAPSFGKPVLLHDPTSRGAIAHLQFARELLARNGIKVAEAA